MATEYVPVGWDAATPLSAPNMRQLTSIETCLKSNIDEHLHSTVHYSESESDAKFFGSGLEVGLDADLLDGKTLAEVLGGQAPKGLHLVWSGDDEDFVGGYLVSDNRWHLADGGTYNGIYTTDMRGYFPRSALVNNGTGTGGASEIVMSGTVTVAGHILTINEIPSHYHKFQDGWSDATVYDYWGGTSGVQASGKTGSWGHYTENAGSGTAHNHGTVGINLTVIDKNPAYKALYFICKVSD